MSKWRVVEWIGRNRHVRTLKVCDDWQAAVDFAQDYERTEADATGRRIIGWIPADDLTVRGSVFRPGSTATLKVVR